MISMTGLSPGMLYRKNNDNGKNTLEIIERYDY